MADGSRRWLKGSRSRLRLDPSAEREILSELHTHFEDRVEELERSGRSHKEASRIAAAEFGSVGRVTGELSEVHNTSNWPQALMAALPHVLFSLLFAFQQWSNIIWLLVILISVFGVVIYGWQHGRPTWFFTWLGYALLPLLVVGLVVLDQALAQGISGGAWWLWSSVILYFSVVAAIYFIIMLQILRRDWLLGSLTVLPFLAVVGWFFAGQWREELLQDREYLLSGLEPWIAMSFLTLAGMVILFARLRKRWLKVGVLLVGGLALLTIMASAAGGAIGPSQIFVLALLAIVVLMGPALLDRRTNHTQTQDWEDFLSGHSR